MLFHRRDILHFRVDRNESPAPFRARKPLMDRVKSPFRLLTAPANGAILVCLDFTPFRLVDCMIFNIDKETRPREKIREIQLSRLQDLCRRVYANVPFYRRSFDEKGIKPSDVQSLDDLKFLPFTLKQDMRNNYPYGLFAVPMEMIQRIHASSGTTGKATVVGYTKRDIETWAECARPLSGRGRSHRQ